jgi:hypothetical protein
VNWAFRIVTEPHNIQIALERRSGMDDSGVEVLAEWPPSENTSAITVGDIPKRSRE